MAVGDEDLEPGGRCSKWQVSEYTKQHHEAAWPLREDGADHIYRSMIVSIIYIDYRQSENPQLNRQKG